MNLPPLNTDGPHVGRWRLFCISEGGYEAAYFEAVQFSELPSTPEIQRRQQDLGTIAWPRRHRTTISAPLCVLSACITDIGSRWDRRTIEFAYSRPDSGTDVYLHLCFVDVYWAGSRYEIRLSVPLTLMFMEKVSEKRFEVACDFGTKWNRSHELRDQWNELFRLYQYIFILKINWLFTHFFQRRKHVEIGILTHTYVIN